MKMRSLAAALPLTAALFVGATATSAAATTSADPAGTSNVSAQDVWEYTGKDYYWQTDCAEEGEDMLEKGHIKAYRCDGSEWVFDDYSLFVIWNK